MDAWDNSVIADSETATVLADEGDRGTVKSLFDRPPVIHAHPVAGTLVGFVDQEPLVIHSGRECATSARSIVDLDPDHVGCEVLVSFLEGRIDQPVILGLLRGERTSPEISALVGRSPRVVEVDADGERILITAAQQLVLRCGHSSITLTKAGKILIQGKYVSSRSSGVNRIKGGSIQLN